MDLQCCDSAQRSNSLLARNAIAEQIIAVRAPSGATALLVLGCGKKTATQVIVELHAEPSVLVRNSRRPNALVLGAKTRRDNSASAATRAIPLFQRGFVFRPTNTKRPEYGSTPK